MKKFTLEEVKSLSRKLKDNQRIPLRNIFNVTNIEFYRNISVYDLNFNNRAQNQLRENNMTTLADILSRSTEDLTHLRNIGKSSVENILSALANFFKARQIEEEEIDLAENFSPEDYLQQNILPLLHALPDQIKDKNFTRLVQVYNLDALNAKLAFSKTLPSDLSVEEFPQFFITNKIGFDKVALKDFVEWLNFDLKKMADDMIYPYIKKDWYFEVLERRIAGQTLQEIGDHFNLTRERVRQVEYRLVNNFELHCRFKAEQLFFLLNILTDRQPILTAECAEKFIGESTKLIWFYMSKVKFSKVDFHYDFDTQAIVFYPPPREEINYTALVRFLPDFMHKDDMEKAIKRIAEEKKCCVDLLRMKVEQIFNREGDFFYRYQMSPVYKCGYILREKFPDGYKISNETYYKKMVRYLKEIFHDKTFPNSRNVDLKIARVGVMCGRGKYIHPDYIKVPPELIDIIKDFVDNSKRDVLPFKEIFQQLKSHFVGTQITDHYILQGVMRLYDCPYIFFKDYVTKNIAMNLSGELTRFVERKGTVNLADIKAEFPSFSDTNIPMMVQRCKDIIATGNGNFIHSRLLNLESKDYAALKEVVSRACKNYPVTSRYLFDLCREDFQDFFERNQIDSHEKFVGILRHMFRDDFHFCRPFVAAEDITGITNREVLLLHIGKVDKISVEKVLGICEEQKINYLSKLSLTETLSPEFIRADEENFYRPESIGLTSEIISQVAQAIKAELETGKGWLSVKDFKDYKKLPRLKVQWTVFLLDGVIALAGDAVKTLKVSYASSEITSTIFISEKFANDTFRRFLMKILRERQEEKNFRDANEVLDWLKERGICKTRLPKFLTEKYFSRDAEGHFIIK